MTTTMIMTTSSGAGSAAVKIRTSGRLGPPDHPTTTPSRRRRCQFYVPSSTLVPAHLLATLTATTTTTSPPSRPSTSTSSSSSSLSMLSSSIVPLQISSVGITTATTAPLATPPFKDQELCRRTDDGPSPQPRRPPQPPKQQPRGCTRQSGKRQGPRPARGTTGGKLPPPRRKLHAQQYQSWRTTTTPATAMLAPPTTAVAATIVTRGDNSSTANSTCSGFFDVTEETVKVMTASSFRFRPAVDPVASAPPLLPPLPLRLDAPVVTTPAPRHPPIAVVVEGGTITATPETRRAMRHISGLGMEDPTQFFAAVSQQNQQQLQQKADPVRDDALPLFQDMTIDDIPHDIRTTLSVESDPTATISNEGVGGGGGGELVNLDLFHSSLGRVVNGSPTPTTGDPEPNTTHFDSDMDRFGLGVSFHSDNLGAKASSSNHTTHRRPSGWNSRNRISTTSHSPSSSLRLHESMPVLNVTIEPRPPLSSTNKKPAFQAPPSVLVLSSLQPYDTSSTTPPKKPVGAAAATVPTPQPPYDGAATTAATELDVVILPKKRVLPSLQILFPDSEGDS